MNVLSLSHYGERSVALHYPFNTFDRTWPDLAWGEEISAVTSEGWTFPQKYQNSDQNVSLMSTYEAVKGSLEQAGIKATLSAPGHIARQMLEYLGGIVGVTLLGDVGTLALMNKTAGGWRRKSNEKDTVEESFELRTASIDDWKRVIDARGKKPEPRWINMDEFVTRRVLRLGLETDCPHCLTKNWSSLTDADYSLTCERCLNKYDFPQARLRSGNKNFSYRIVGPFSVQDDGKGSYSALLRVRLRNVFSEKSV